MAAIPAAAPKHHRHRSISDPFSDPSPHPHLAQVPRSQQGPPTPTKSYSSSRDKAPPRNYSSGSNPMTEVARASADTPRQQVYRSQTGGVQSSARPRNDESSRSVSQDSVVRAATTVQKSKTTAGKSGKKGSSHADVIDRLDFSGVGPMFHHDGPFDACAPSRNRHKTKAPMLAWAAGDGKPRDDPLAEAYTPSDSPYPKPRRERNEEKFATPVIPYQAPKKGHDALAEAWGIHEPEPFEEFFAGGGPQGRGGSVFNNQPGAAAPAADGQAPPSAYKTHASQDRPNGELQDKYRAYVEDEHRAGRGRRGDRPGGDRPRRAPLPPPQPIFVPENGEATDPDQPLSGGMPSPGGGPKRSKSLMQRIRKMRDNPNMPAGSQDMGDYSDSGAYGSPPSGQAVRPGHRSKPSFLGRIATREGQATGMRPEASRSPTSEKSADFVVIDDPRTKDLPSPPGAADAAELGYFDENGASGSGGGGGLGRKTSLMKKAKGIMRGGK